jgi:hypothetical protein
MAVVSVSLDPIFASSGPEKGTFLFYVCIGLGLSTFCSTDWPVFWV